MKLMQRLLVMVIIALLMISVSVMAGEVSLTDFTEDQIEWDIWKSAGKMEFKYTDETWGPKGAKSLLVEVDAGGSGSAESCMYYVLPLKPEAIAVKFYMKPIKGNAAFHLMFNELFGGRVFHTKTFHLNELKELSSGGVSVEEDREVSGSIAIISKPGREQGLEIEDANNGWYEVMFYVDSMEHLCEWSPNGKFDRPSKELYLYFWKPMVLRCYLAI